MKGEPLNLKNIKGLKMNLKQSEERMEVKRQGIFENTKK